MPLIRKKVNMVLSKNTQNSSGKHLRLVFNQVSIILFRGKNLDLRQQHTFRSPNFHIIHQTFLYFVAKVTFHLFYPHPPLFQFFLNFSVPHDVVLVIELLYFVLMRKYQECPREFCEKQSWCLLSVMPTCQPVPAIQTEKFLSASI